MISYILRMLRGAEANLLNVNFFTVNFNIDKKTPDLSISVSANAIRNIGDTKMPVGMEKIRVDDDSDGVLIFNAPNTRRLEEAKVSHLLDDDAETEEDETYDECDDENEDDQLDEDSEAYYLDEHDYELDEDSEAYYLDEHDYELDEEDWNRLEEWCNDIAELDRIIQEHVHSNKVKYPGEGYVWVEPGDTRVDGDEYWYPNRSSAIFNKKELISVELSWREASVGHTVMFSKQIRRKVS